jgi:hypothetical protein
MSEFRSHLFIPDNQIKPEVPTDHLEAIGNYMVAKQPDVVILAGDFADVPSLSQYERPGSKKAEGQRYSDDIAAAWDAMARLMRPLNLYNIKQKRDKKKQYNPRLVVTLGNHEDRINRAIADNPRNFEGVISVDDLPFATHGWEVIPYQHIIDIDGILYSHVFINPDSLLKSALGGTIENRISKLKRSFSQGHQQIFKYGMGHDAVGRRYHGLVAGLCTMHDEDYLGPQGNGDWRGIVMKKEVHDGTYDPQFLSINYLLRQWL